MQNYVKDIAFVFKKEVQAILSSPYRLGLVTWIPLIGLFLLISIFFKGVVNDLPIGVVDKDHSSLSRLLIQQLDASATMTVQEHTLREAKQLLQRSKIYALIIIEHDFEKRVRLEQQPAVIAMINTQYILIGKIISAALSTTVMQSAGRVDFVKNLVDEVNAKRALTNVAPMGVHLTPLFNSYKNYFPFLVGAMLPALWQVFIVIAVIISVGTMVKEEEEMMWFKASHNSVLVLLVGKMMPYTLIFLLYGLLFLSFIYFLMPWPFEGSYLFMLLTQLITILAYQSVALLLFVVGFDYARSLSLGAVYTAPAFAFMGITFPVSNMPSLALFWHHMLPISYYQKIQIAQANYGAPLIEMLPNLGFILLFMIVLPLVYWRFKVRLEQA